MQSTQNLPTIEDEALDGVSGGVATIGSLAAQAVQNGMKITTRVASDSFGLLGTIFTGISDLLKAVSKP